MDATRQPENFMLTDRKSADGWLTRSFQINWETTVFIVILLLAIFTRFYNLGTRTMSHDESLHTKFSWDLYKNGVFQHTPLMHGPILFHVTALDYFLFGDNDFTARIYPAVLGVLMVMFPLLFRRWFGKWPTILASLMFLISPLILYYNRYIREDTPSIFFTLIMVYCTLTYLNGPPHLRRKARWLYGFSAAMLASLATKEVAFMYISIFFGLLLVYWLVRVGQYYWHLPGKSLFYFLTITVMLGGVTALIFYVIVSVIPIATALSQAGTADFNSFIIWSLTAIVTMLLVTVGTMLWISRRNSGRKPWVDVLPMLALIVVVTSVLLIIDVASQIPKDQEVPPFSALPLYAEWILAIVAIAGLIVTWRAGLWNKLRRFPEVDLMVIMVTLILPWATPFIMKAMHPKDVTSLVDVANAVQNAIPFIQFDLTQTGMQIALVSLTVWPAIFVSAAIGLIWNPKRWLICVAIFHALFLFFYTTVFTNLYGIGTGMFGSLGYWLQQQSERRGSQPQYYYLGLIMPFYEFLPVIGSILAMLSGMAIFWRFRQERIAARDQRQLDASLAYSGDELPPGLGVVVPDEANSVMPIEPQPIIRRRGNIDPAEWLGRMPILIFFSWWAVFILIAFTLAGEKMPWLGTHLTTPLIFLAAWYFGRFFASIDVEAFFKRNWLYILLLPLLFVAFAQLVAPFIFGGLGGLEQVQLTKMFQWIAGIVVGAGAIYGIYRLVMFSGFKQLRIMIGVMVFVSLAFLTFRSAWMAAFINYDLATEFLVYAHGAPANKQVEQQIEDLSKRITGGMDLKFGYDFKISWPGAWYFRNFPTATAKFLGENPSPKDMQDQMVVIVGDENKSKAVDALSDNYYEFDYPRMWWPMQDYFNLTADRVINTLDLNNPNSAAIRQGIWDIWWRRDYTAYGEATQKDFSLTKWPVADRMYVFIRKDIAAQVWNLGVGEGQAVSANTLQTNQCTANWQPLQADKVYEISGNTSAMNHPRQIAVAKDGKIYVAEEFNHRISIFNPDGTYASSFGQLGQLYTEGDPYFGKTSGADSGGVFNRPSGIAIGPSGNIYVADTWNYRIQVFTPDGKFLNAWGQRGEFGNNAQSEPFDGFWGPRGIAVDSQENVYVADTGNKRVRVYTSNGQYLRDIGSSGSDIGQLDEPSSMVIGPDNLLYVTDYWNKRISVFTLDGAPVTTYTDTAGAPVNSFKVRGWQDDQGNRPYIAMDAARKLLYITDPDAGRVLVYSTDGNCVGSFGELNTDPTNITLSQLNSVGGVDLDSEGNVYVADAGAGRILRFVPFPAPVVVQPVGQPQSGVIQPNSGNGAEVTVEPAEITVEPFENTLEVTPEVMAAG